MPSIKHLLDQNWNMPRLYGIPILEPKLIRLKKFRDECSARYVTNRYHNTSSVTDMLQNFNWPSLEIRRTRVRLIMFYKIIHHVVAIHPLDTLLLPTTTITRYNSSHTYQHIRTDKDSYKYSFYPRTIIQWNLLPIHVHEAVTVDAFKALVPVTVLAPIYHV